MAVRSTNPANYAYIYVREQQVSFILREEEAFLGVTRAHSDAFCAAKTDSARVCFCFAQGRAPLQVVNALESSRNTYHSIQDRGLLRLVIREGGEGSKAAGDACAQRVPPFFLFKNKMIKQGRPSHRTKLAIDYPFFSNHTKSFSFPP
jgi:hypothetical protein